jgi:sugar phosphate isomerase/epimerase
VHISVQLYSVRAALADDQHGTLQALKSQGFEAVEPFGWQEKAASLGPELAELGLSAPSTHAAVLGSEDQESLFESAATYGVQTVIDPHRAAEHWQDLDSIRRTADLLNEAAATAARHGVRMGYHNHAHEITPRFDGRTALEVLTDTLDPTVRLEVDTYWAAVGGADPVQLISALGDRVFAVHLKDGPRSGETEKQKPLGQGEIDVDAIIEASEDLELGVIEFDGYEGDVLEAVAASRTYLASAIGEGEAR